MSEAYFTFGVTLTAPDTYDMACRIIQTTSEARAIEIAESLGNLPGTTTAYTDEGLIALQCERPDWIEVDGAVDADSGR